ncbi:unnamed protein product [Fraxinus pennsylvanica]|uniref:Aminotransferase-like plant mobile domain-containing protein n=1 Tax=Fraxinus pennsylvanica TaxID=56036 RepID=A0AAD1YZS4_9LAMI|nr:unnamed protein product [Fraxinus pennsylvanica]
MFMDKGTESEHIAFLSLWLSRFVFPGNEQDHIGNHVFWIAIYLARGTRFVLAPAVLASIYRDVGLFKASMADSTQRMAAFYPLPFGELRLARWKGLKKLDIGNVRPAINYAGETFLWRPYALAVHNWSIPKLYKEKEDWVVGNDIDSELESLARCLRPYKLVWIDCQEPYNPHRVAMQFGLDQDLPGWISRDNISRDIAWYNFTGPLSYDNWIYLLSRLSESDVTAQLQTGSKLQCDEGFSRQVKHYPAALFQSASTMTGGVGLSSKMKLIVKQEEDTKQQNSSTDRDVPPGFLPKSIEGKGKTIEKDEEDSVHIVGARITRSMTRSKTNTDKSQQSKLKKDYHPDVPSGFPPKSKGIEIKCNEERSSFNVEPHKMHPGIKLGGHNVQGRFAKGKSFMVEEQAHGITSGELRKDIDSERRYHD